MLKMFWLKQNPFTVSLCWLLLLLHTQNAVAFIVPQELPSLLSVVYSNIPPIKKGTDSRLGFGFRLGEHADFQVLLELGPQKETKPIGEPSKDDQSFNKRQVSASELRQQQLKAQLEDQLLTSTERNAASWLDQWANGMKPQKQHKAKAKPRQPQLQSQLSQLSQLPQLPQMAPDAVQQLQLLYKMATSSTTTPTPPLNPGSGFSLPPPALTQDTNSLSLGVPIKNRAEITKQLMDVSLESA